MTDAWIVSACRTPIGKFRGALSTMPATELGAVAVRAALERAQIPASEVDEVVLGQVLAAGVGQAPARQAALHAGLPASVAALTINKVCGSGLKAVMLASQAVRCGDAHLVVAGGMETMSLSPWALPRQSPPMGDLQLIDTMLWDGLRCGLSQRSMGDIAESVCDANGISRAELDAYSLRSHQRAIAAQDAGRFAAEIVPVTPPRGKPAGTVTIDEGPRRDSSLAGLAALKPAFRPNGSVTAGNASMISDGAAAVVVASSAAVERLGVRPLARIRAACTSGGQPEDLFTAPVEAIRQVVQRGGLALHNVDLFELNEAFAAQMIACLRPLNLDPEQVNVHGGAIALGHPIGASGARVLVTLLHALQHAGKQFGVAALCLGGGNAVAMLVERVERTV
jgi:acetyl-CoA C-acetyltransferase